MSALIEQLRALVPDDESEAASLSRIIAHVEAGGELFARDRWDGHLTASAFIIDSTREHVLLLLHKKLGKWLQPGGHGDPGERDPLVVAKREALEETSLQGLELASWAPQPFDVDVHEIPARKDEPQHQHLDIRYLFVAPPGVSPVLDPNESQGWAWVSLKGDSRYPSDHSVERACAKIMRLTSR
ncbi:MAG: NUDIX domain-containing protein [Polyangiaceae bacterium]